MMRHRHTVGTPRGRFAHALVGVITLEALFFDAWPALAAALAVVILDTVVPTASPLAWAFDRVGLAAGEAIRQPVYRLSGAIVGVGLLAALAAFVGGADVAGRAFAALVAVAALASAVVGFRFWGRAYDRRPWREHR